MADNTGTVRQQIRQSWSQYFRRARITLKLSMTGTIVLLVYCYLFFWRLRIAPAFVWLDALLQQLFGWQMHVAAYIASAESVLYDWGAIGLVIILYFILKLPRILLQVPGDEGVAVSQGLMSMFTAASLALILGRVSMGWVLPDYGVLALCLFSGALVLIFTIEQYISVRYAERTGEFGFTPPGAG